MILQALHEHYLKLIDDSQSGIALPGYSPVKVSHALVLSTDGEVLDVWRLADVKGKKLQNKIYLLPEQVGRTSGIAANILCDNPSYVLGVERTKQGDCKISLEKFQAFRIKNVEFLGLIDGTEAKAVMRFLENWNPGEAPNHPVVGAHTEEILQGSNIIFKIDGCEGFVHEDPHIKDTWDKLSQADSGDEVGQCLVTGQHLPIARIHPMIKGIVGAQTSGASIVSFNVDSFTSYGKSQSFNAPVSKKAAFAYGTALNHLIASHTNRLRIADTTFVFWADKKGARAEEAILAWSLDPVSETQTEEDESRSIDPSAQRQARTILEHIRAGIPVVDSEFDFNTRCYLLGLAPNAARLSVRFWQISSFGDVLSKIAQHYNDMNIIGIDRWGGFVSPWRILKALAVREETKNVPPLLGGQFLRAILTGQAYPQLTFNLALNRCRIGGDYGGVNTIRAAVIKAFLQRKHRISGDSEREAMITVGLNESNTNAAYQLGRLFSLLEKVQKDALGNQINATIRDRYFGAASATPGSVFPLLLRLSRHHIAKAEYGELMDRKMQDVIVKLDKFPSHLTMEEQGEFILGYYHQNQANYTKSEKISKEEG